MYCRKHRGVLKSCAPVVGGHIKKYEHRPANIDWWNNNLYTYTPPPRTIELVREKIISITRLYNINLCNTYNVHNVITIYTYYRANTSL